MQHTIHMHGAAMKYFHKYLKLDIIGTILDLLYQELPPGLVYHNVSHTLHVMQWAMIFADKAGLRNHQRELLAIAAAFHDSGYLTRLQDNESLGIANALDAMGAAGRYSEADYQEVIKMISSTEMVPCEDTFVQKPQSQLANFLCDADLFSFGQPDFLVYSTAIMLEQGTPITESQKFLRKTLRMMEVHKWHSAPAKALFTEQKKQNMILLRQIVNAR